MYHFYNTLYYWRIIPLLIAAILYESCTYNHVPPDGGICFETQILPIIKSNCANSGCHDAQTKKEGFDFSSYKGIKKAVNVGSPSSSELLTYMSRTDEKRMPPSPAAMVSKENQDLILQWIQEGAWNTTNCTAATCDSTEFKYSTSIKTIMETNCLGSGCHNSTDKSAGYDLSAYTGVENCATSGALVSSVIQDGNTSFMPKNGAKLGNCDITKIQKWVAAGAPNN